MTSRQRMRRAAFICIHTLTNAACYIAGTDSLRVMGKQHFWLRAHNNFAEMAVLHWCKVFADKKAKHYCLKVITKPERFAKRLLEHIGLNQNEFDTYAVLMRNLRDKFIAHLDDDISAVVPKLDTAIASASFMLTYLIQHENKEGIFEGLPMRPDPVYSSAFEDARFAYTGGPTVENVGDR